MLEKEMKILLSKEIFLEILNSNSWQREFTQINHYYLDSNNDAVDKDVTIRIREVDSIKKLQIKVKRKCHIENKSIHVKDEYEKLVEAIPDELSSEEIYELCNIKLDGIKKIGSLTTIRREFDYKDTTIFLDQNTYFNVTDYELEIEYQDCIYDFIYDFLKKYNLNFNSESKGKYKRFYLEYTKEKKL